MDRPYGRASNIHQCKELYKKPKVQREQLSYKQDIKELGNGVSSLKADCKYLALQYAQFMQLQPKSSQQNHTDSKSQQSALSASHKLSTLGNLIEGISFQVYFDQSQKKTKPIKKKTFSQTSSISSSQSVKSKQKSKLWTQQQNQKFILLIKKHGPDFQTLGPFFDKKSKNQLKNKYKEYLINEKKKSKQSESGKLQAVTVGSLFSFVDQKQEYP